MPGVSGLCHGFADAVNEGARIADNPTGIKRVGVRLMDGDGVERNLILAEEYLNKAKQMGVADMDFILGKLYYFQGKSDKAIPIFESLYSSDGQVARLLGSCYAKKTSTG